MLELDVAIYDPTDCEAIIEIDWAQQNVEGVSVAKTRLLRYTADGLLWVGVVFGVPFCADVAAGTIRMEGREFAANLRQLEAFVR